MTECSASASSSVGRPRRREKASRLAEYAAVTIMMAAKAPASHCGAVTSASAAQPVTGKVSATAAVPAANPATAAAPATATGPTTTWWDRFRLTALRDASFGTVAALGAVGLIILGAAPMAAAQANPNADPILAEAIGGPPPS
jgi:hypothetical protein